MEEEEEEEERKISAPLFTSGHAQTISGVRARPVETRIRTTSREGAMANAETRRTNSPMSTTST